MNLSLQTQTFSSASTTKTIFNFLGTITNQLSLVLVLLISFSISGYANNDISTNDHFEIDEVLPAITISVPFAKDAYQEKTARRFGNQAIGDTVARICADGMAKFPIFIRPTIEGCFVQGILPNYAIASVASWYVFACHVAAGKIPFDYVEPSWDALAAMLGTDEFYVSEQLWGSVPKDYPEFQDVLRQKIAELEEKWPV